MAGKDNRSDEMAAVRQRAEGKARSEAGSAVEGMSPERILQTLHELRVHQFELEMQNHLCPNVLVGGCASNS